MSVRCPLEREGRALYGFAATLTDDPALVELLVARAVLHATDVTEPDAWNEAVRVFVVRGLLSKDYTLGAPVAVEVDEPVDAVDGADDLAGRLARSSRLQRAVVALHFGQHLDATGVARVVGSSEPEISSYLHHVRRDLRITSEAEALGLSRLLRDRAAASADRAARTGALRTTDRLAATDQLAATDRLGAADRPCGAEPSATGNVTAAADLASLTDDIAGQVDDMFRDSVREPPPYPSLRVVRPLVALTVVLGLNYLVWRWIFSINWSAWFVAVPLVLAETYSLVDSMIFGVTVWQLKRRPEPEPPPADATVDVFISTCHEPLDMVMKAARAAQRITYPHTLWILDDGNRPELRELAGSEGIGVLSGSSDWIDLPRHTEAGNLNNGLMVTQGEFIVILDADQVPVPQLLDRTLGYFRDEKMAVVQTPHVFVDPRKSDPLGSLAPLISGPIQQGRDGWDSAFFCGSNAVLRRAALLQMGVRRHVPELPVRIDDALSTSQEVIRRARAALPPDQPAIFEALTSVLDAARDVRAELAQTESIADATSRFRRRVHAAARRVVAHDLAESRAELDELFELVDEQVARVTTADRQSEALDRIARRDWSPLGALETAAALIAVVDHEVEAQQIMPRSTISVAQDLATCLRMHSNGWKSAFHDEVLAVGPAPENLGTMLTRRLRRAQGTNQAMLRENPLRQKGLSLPQKVMYLGAIWSCLAGFATLAYLAAPMGYLVFGILPVDALSVQFFARLVPFVLVNQLLFLVIGRGRSTWRGRQYSFALFPVWIKAATSAVGDVAFGRNVSFAAGNPKERVQVRPWRLVRPQLVAVGLLVVAAAIGVVRLAAGQATVLGTSVNLIWVVIDLVLFGGVMRALFHRGFEQSDNAVTPLVSTPEPRAAAVLQEVTR